MLSDVLINVVALIFPLGLYIAFLRLLIFLVLLLMIEVLLGDMREVPTTISRHALGEVEPLALRHGRK